MKVLIVATAFLMLPLLTALGAEQLSERQRIERYMSRGDYGLAAEVAEQVVERISGDGDSDELATALNNLGLIRKRQGRYEQAAGLYEQALEVNRRLYGADDAGSLIILNNMAELAKSQGQVDRAREILQKCLRISKERFGRAHPQTALAFNNLAGLYFAEQDYDRAGLFYKRSLSIVEGEFGPESLAAGAVIGNLAGVYHYQGHLAAAGTLYRRAIWIVEQSDQGDDLARAGYLVNLAAVYYAQGDYEQAIEHGRAGAQIRRQLLGAEHDLVAEAFANLGAMYQQADEPDLAQQSYRKAVEIWTDNGRGCQAVVSALTNLAQLCALKGNLAEGERFLGRAVQVQYGLGGWDGHQMELLLERLVNMMYRRGRILEASGYAGLLYQVRQANQSS